MTDAQASTTATFEDWLFESYFAAHFVIKSDDLGDVSIPLGFGLMVGGITCTRREGTASALASVSFSVRRHSRPNLPQGYSHLPPARLHPFSLG